MTTQQTNDVKAALVSYAPGLGGSVVALALRTKALGVDGVSDVPTFTLGVAPSPVGTSNIPITALQIATFDTTHITVNGI